MASEERRQLVGMCQHQKQVNKYLQTELLGRSEDHLLWWSTLGSQLYPAVATIAQRFLSIPATQASSERVFSTARNIVTTRREHLLPEHVEELLLLYDNCLICVPFHLVFYICVLINNSY
ncbi:hypothetical protein HPB48_016340 [Haemaphysalis longicornis]|uniref:HAT C-terminal dimerisation domain-containing protein n=1 Tax=Haemaphysalis longicornis TaxID=44386 RepID=A0A9J6H475_HAELO|nr:hypothetical protein HPB48_016340 [Haemaphysalis longicornis]